MWNQKLQVQGFILGLARMLIIIFGDSGASTIPDSSMEKYKVISSREATQKWPSFTKRI